MKKYFSRKFILCVLWFGLLGYCCYIDGDFIKSGFCTILAITGAIVTSAFVLGNYLLRIEQIKLSHGNTTIELKANNKANNKKEEK